nr:hypothetical protein [uncultured Roseibium sp.]
MFEGLEITACASVDIEESRTKAAQHGVRFIRATIVSHNEGSIRVDFCRRAMTWHFPGTKSVHFQENQALPIT